MNPILFALSPLIIVAIVILIALYWPRSSNGPDADTPLHEVDEIDRWAKGMTVEATGGRHFGKRGTITKLMSEWHHNFGPLHQIYIRFDDGSDYRLTGWQDHLIKPVRRASLSA